MESAAAAATRLQTAPNNGAYVLRELIRQVPLSADGDDENIHITCVEAWGMLHHLYVSLDVLTYLTEGNLYIGTSAAEILHFVSIPPDPASGDDQPTYILASRTEPAYTNQQLSPYSVPGVEQILLLPQAGKACILCNGTLTFYTLPELSPAFGGKIKQTDCTWVGGIDQNLLDDEDSETTDDAVVIICLKQKLRLIRIGEQARKIRDIEVGSILDVQKRGDLACVADSRAYALLDVVNQQKIDLFPISSSSGQDSDPGSPTGSAPSHANRPPSRSFSARSPVRRPDLRGHERVSSLGAAPKDHNRLRPGRPSTLGPSAASHNTLSPSPTRPKSPRIDTDNKLLPPTPQFETPEPTLPPPKSVLRPHIATPNGNEFLLTTGTSATDPGVGMFVNLDGDVVRGTIEFSSYPDALVLDGHGLNSSSTPSPGQGSEEGYVLAIVRRCINGKEEQVVEYQRWDVNQGDSQFIKDYLLLPSTSPNESSTEHDGTSPHIGLRNAMTPISLTISTLGNSLGLRRLYITDQPETESEADLKRVKDEDQLIAQFANVQAKVLLFSQDRVWWLVRNPLVVQLESQLSAANIVTDQGLVVQREAVEKIINTIRGQEASNEFEFLGFNYIRQEASLLLLIDLIAKTEAGVYAFEHDKRATHDALISGEIDPRIILSIIPILADEVIEGPQGIWVPGGLRDTIVSFKKTQDPAAMNQDVKGAYGDNLLQVIKHFLFVWRRKKGFGSVADEKQVFHTVDAALLHLLLMLDSNSPRGPATAGSLRSELNDVVDHGVECFDRAVALLEQHKRLYILSRLYQSRKMIGHVLATWKRIVDGEPDAGGELIDGEQDVRKYLTRIKDPVLVKDYGTWLANRNPKLGVQVFAEETSRVKFTPTEAVALLKEKAPGAVKDYLEYLVFGKNVSIDSSDHSQTLTSTAHSIRQ